MPFHLFIGTPREFKNVNVLHKLFNERHYTLENLRTIRTDTEKESADISKKIDNSPKDSPEADRLFKLWGLYQVGLNELGDYYRKTHEKKLEEYRRARHILVGRIEFADSDYPALKLTRQNKEILETIVKRDEEMSSLIFPGLPMDEAINYFLISAKEKIAMPKPEIRVYLADQPTTFKSKGSLIDRLKRYQYDSENLAAILEQTMGHLAYINDKANKGLVNREEQATAIEAGLEILMEYRDNTFPDLKEDDGKRTRKKLS